MHLIADLKPHNIRPPKAHYQCNSPFLSHVYTSIDLRHMQTLGVFRTIYLFSYHGTVRNLKYISSKNSFYTLHYRLKLTEGILTAKHNVIAYNFHIIIYTKLPIANRAPPPQKEKVGRTNQAVYYTPGEKTKAMGFRQTKLVIGESKCQKQ